MILVDARKGLLTQTRRHSYLVKLMGIRHVVLAVNKMDLVDYSQGRFQEIAADYNAFAAGLGRKEGRAEMARLVAVAGLFDLDELSPQIDEDLRGEGAG